MLLFALGDVHWPSQNDDDNLKVVDAEASACDEHMGCGFPDYSVA